MRTLTWAMLSKARHAVSPANGTATSSVGSTPAGAGTHAGTEQGTAVSWNAPHKGQEHRAGKYWLTALAAVDEISVRPFSGRVQRCRHNVAARISPRERAELDDLADEIPACGERRRNAGQWEELPAVPAHHPAVHCAKEATPVLTPRRTWNPRGSSPRAGEHTWIYGRCKHPDAELVRPGPQHRAAAVLHGEHFRPAVVLDHRPAHAPPRCRPHLSCDGDTNAL